MTAELTPTERTRLHRLPDRGSYDRATIDAILDEAYNCHLALVDDGKPFVIPTIHARAGTSLFVHGSAASRALRTAARTDRGSGSERSELGGGVEACVA
ncbi:MAG: pyridoxamine 5'-phosphate oxidase family protein, partial [Acidimicrobiales bacterium]